MCKYANATIGKLANFNFDKETGFKAGITTIKSWFEIFIKH